MTSRSVQRGDSIAQAQEIILEFPGLAALCSVQPAFKKCWPPHERQW